MEPLKGHGGKNMGIWFKALHSFAKCFAFPPRNFACAFKEHKGFAIKCKVTQGNAKLLRQNAKKKNNKKNSLPISYLSLCPSRGSVSCGGNAHDVLQINQ